MKLAAWTKKCLRARPPRSQAEDETLQAVNCTRQTVLARALEVAASGEKRRKGLLGRAALAPGEGLWIVPCESVHTFFMRFAIDLVYIDSRKRVKKVRSAVGPGRISFCLTAQSVIELPAGTVQRTQTQLGDSLSIEVTEPQGPSA